MTRYGPAAPVVVPEPDPVPVFVCEGPEHFTVTTYDSGTYMYVYTNTGFYAQYGSAGATVVTASGVASNPVNSPCCVYSSDAAGVPSGAIDTLFVSQVSTIDLSNMSALSQLDILGMSGQLVTPLSVNSLNLQEYQPSTIDLSTCPNLEAFTANLSSLQTVDFSVTPLMGYVTIQSAQLTTAGVDAIINALAANGLTGGLLYLDQGANASPSGASSASLLNLLADGWTVWTN